MDEKKFINIEVVVASGLIDDPIATASERPVEDEKDFVRHNTDAIVYDNTGNK